MSLFTFCRAFSLTTSLVGALITSASGQARPATPPATSLPTHSRPADSTNVNTNVYVHVEQMPRLPGGKSSVVAIQAEIQKRLVRPVAACKGRVYVSFVVRPSGAVGDAVIITGLEGVCDAAVLSAVRQLPRFVPGKQNGQAVSVAFTLPVTF